MYTANIIGIVGIVDVANTHISGFGRFVICAVAIVVSLERAIIAGTTGNDANITASRTIYRAILHNAILDFCRICSAHDIADQNSNMATSCNGRTIDEEILYGATTYLIEYAYIVLV